MKQRGKYKAKPEYFEQKQDKMVCNYRYEYECETLRRKPVVYFNGLVFVTYPKGKFKKCGP